MTYTKRNAEGSDNVFVLTFDADGAEFEAAVARAYEKTKDKYSVQGFRKGKAPRKILEGLYGKGLFYEDAIDILLPEYYDEALAKEKLEPVEQPEVEIVKVGEGGAQFKITLTVLKPFTLGGYKGLEIKKAVFNVGDEDVEREIKQAQDRAGRMVSIEDRAAENGDLTVIDFSGSVDGVKFEGGTAEKFELELGSGSFIPGFEAQVEGMKIGETRDVKVKFPDDYHAEALKGKDAVFEVKVHEIKRKEVPLLDDEFAKDVSEFDTLEAYKADIRARLTEEAGERAKAADEKALIDAIVEKTEIEVPDSFIRKECEALLRQFEYRLMYQGLKIKDYYAYSGQTEDDLKASYRDSASKNVKSRLVMEKIIEAEGIKLDTEKLDLRLAEISDKAHITVGEYKKKMRPEQYDYYANEILTKTLFDFLFENNTFVD